MSERLLLPIFVLGLAAACAGQPPADPRPNALQIMLEPMDLSTAVVPDGVIQLRMLSSGTSFNADNSEALRAALTLSRWPSGDVLVVAYQISADRIRLVPSEPLSAGWYQFRLEPVDPLVTYRIQTRWGTSVTDVGAASIFHVGEEPLFIATVDPDSTDGSNVRVTINGSEPLHLIGSPDSILEVRTGNDAASCQYTMQTDSPANDLAYADGLRFACAGMDIHQDVTLGLHTGLVSVGGVALRSVDGNTDITARWNVVRDGRFSPHALDGSSLPGGGP